MASAAQGSGLKEMPQPPQDQISPDQIPPNQMPADQTLLDPISLDETQSDETHQDQISPDQTRSDETHQDQISPDKTLADQTPGDQTPPDQISPDQTMPHQTPPDQSPPDETPLDDTPSDQIPPDQTPSDEIPWGQKVMTVGDKQLIADEVLQQLPASGDPWSLSGGDFWLDRVKGCIYGNCIGDAIGLLTEFMIKDEAKKYYKKHKKLEYVHKVGDFHRCRWETGDWTDDSDQMILILLSSTSKCGEIDPKDFAQRLDRWRCRGYPELGDCGGMGIGSTTLAVLRHADFLTNPHKAATQVWEQTGRYIAPNGGIMRTSFLGIHHYDNLANVIWNTYSIAKTTHADPRCIASCIAVTTAIAMMLQQRMRHMKKDGSYCVETIMEDAFCIASQFVDDTQKQELHDHMFTPNLRSLALSEPGKIGYTFKPLGAGFWAFRQKKFRDALTATTMEAGDADSNGAVAGALLGCKLGFQQLPKSWVSNLKHREWLEQQIQGYLSAIYPDVVN
ncbi:ADP-ribosylarginine hydrolase Tri1-like [Thalassophryne amazonica]|uniref:ADP-ribosylarginine hydrolase Tri1-like n=1 Tax=Thalassophryne amazonica TaxID=390379 RepID=UPI0014709644|nr:ADP-ribosylarginine hydrolase Tri1-like [Thalassophryne amazonica]XP_034039938.1 ADP-ribosylarginine hydrolase Tri1-like [Thalassophryne amazonica]